MFNRFAKREEVFPPEELLEMFIPQLQERYKDVKFTSNEDSTRFFFDIIDDEDNNSSIKVERGEKSSYNLWVRNSELEEEMSTDEKKIVCWSYDSQLEVYEKEENEEELQEMNER